MSNKNISECSAVYESPISNSHHPSFRKLHERQGRKNKRSRKLGGVLWNAVFWTCNGHCTHEQTASMVAYKTSAQYQASHITEWLGRSFHLRSYSQMIAAEGGGITLGV